MTSLIRYLCVKESIGLIFRGSFDKFSGVGDEWHMETFIVLTAGMSTTCEMDNGNGEEEDDCDNRPLTIDH